MRGGRCLLAAALVCTPLAAAAAPPREETVNGVRVIYIAMLRQALAASESIAGRLQCVPFARALSNVRLIGDAWTWWRKAAGVYARGIAPEPGAVLAFRSIARMPLGHVAVVTRIVGPRQIEIDHANWASPGMISRRVPVLDVSSSNDWSLVRVNAGPGQGYGGLYPAEGFIYGRSGIAEPQIVSIPPANLATGAQAYSVWPQQSLRKATAAQVIHLQETFDR